MDITGPTDPKEIAKGVALRAGLMSVVALVLGGWLFGVVARAASGMVRVLVGAILITIGAGYAAWQVKKVQRRFSGNGSTPVA